MSVYIPGMEMPNGCFYCIFNKHLDPDTDICLLTRDAFDSTFRVVEHRRDNCPLVPVPEHGDLIDRNALPWEKQGKMLTDPDEWGLKATDIENAPTIIPADPVEVDNG